MPKSDPTLVSIIHHYKARNAIPLIQNFIPTATNNVDTIDPREETTPLLAAVSVGNPKLVQAVLAHGPDLNKPLNAKAVPEALDILNYHASLAEHKFHPDKKCDILKDLEEVLSLVLKYKSLFEKGEPFSGVF